MGLACALACATDGASGLDATTEDAGRADAAPDLPEDASTDARRDDAGTDDAGLDCDGPYAAVADPPEPPWGGTLFIDPNILTDADPSAFVDLRYAGQAPRTMFDRRTASFNEENAHLFDARFGTDTVVEVQVNPEFSREDAEREARFYAEAIGRMPAFLFRDLDTVWIHRGREAFGGGNRNLLIHTEQGQDYVRDGLLEETFLHEGAHTSLDDLHARDPRWLQAQEADGTFLSTYARDNPFREDVAETLGPYLAARFFRDRVPAELVAAVEATVPSRIRYLDCLGLSPAPVD